MNFLDVRIERAQDGFKINIYKKTCKIDTYVHYYYAHQMSKRAVFSQIFIRVFNLCNNDFQSEIDKIYNIGKNLQYSTWVLNCCENTAWNRRTFSHKQELGISPPGDKQNPEFIFLVLREN